MKSYFDLIGLPINSYGENTQKYLDEFSKLQEKNRLGWIQIYILPNTTNTHLKKFNNKNLGIIVHAAHEFHGLDFEKGLNQINTKIIDEAIESSNKLNAKFLIFHPGYTSYNIGMSFEDMKKIDNNALLIYEYIFRNIPEKTKVLMENMPLWSGNKKGIFSIPEDPIIDYMNQYDFGVCLDLATIGLNVNFFPHHLLSSPQKKELIFNKGINRIYELFLNGAEVDYLTQEYFNNLESRQSEVLARFMKLNPKVFHTRGMGFYDLMRHPKKLTNLNYFQLAQIVSYLKSERTPLILEVPINTDFHFVYLEQVEKFILKENSISSNIRTT